MIKHLSGTLLHQSGSCVVLSCHGVGYGLDLPLSSLSHLPKVGSSCELWVYTKVREDAIALFGFLTYEERQVFEVLLNISGVGPKVAMAILSTMDLFLLRSAAESKRADLLEQVPGIGRKTAEKILLELHGKLDRFPLLRQSTVTSSATGKVQPAFDFDGPSDERLEFNALTSDVLSALTHLGFKDKQVKSAIAQTIVYPFDKSLSDAIKLCLSFLTKDQNHSGSNKDLDALF